LCRQWRALQSRTIRGSAAPISADGRRWGGAH
jgi:hypothetical protein